MTPPLLRSRPGYATCPSCHTIDTFVTNEALATGSDWKCARCGGQWNATRLATAAGYAVWLSDHENLPKGRHDQHNDALTRR